MGQHLVLSIRLHDRRYHGIKEWPPGPARVFQALVAGIARGSHLPRDASRGLEWLEGLPAPVIAAPNGRLGQRVGVFVPNNDADTLDGDLTGIADIRVEKAVTPRLLEDESPFIYAWLFGDGDEVAELEGAANQLYQLGRGVDMAWAHMEVLDEDALEDRLAEYRGTVHRPASEGAVTLACPAPGSLASLVRRHEETAQRLRENVILGGRAQLFSQPSKPRFAQIAYATPTVRRVYELRRADDDSDLHPWPMARAVALVERLRDGAADRLRRALPEQLAAIEQTLIGRKSGGAVAGPIAARVRVLPLPSIGHEYADRAIRRVVVEVPPGARLAPADIQWAFSGLEASDPETGVVEPFVLVSADDERMLGHYTAPARIWRTVTPAALPESAKRRRIEPARQREEAKGASERASEENRAIAVVGVALRQAGVHGERVCIRVQREPFEAKGTRAEKFAEGTRFSKERLWHVEVAFSAPVAGPLVIGDGRFLGLGVMAPERASEGIHVFVVDAGLEGTPQPMDVTRALRRAIIARVQATVGRRESVPGFFSGHEPDGSPAKTERTPHLSFVFDPSTKALLILAPHVVARRDPSRDEQTHLQTLDEAMSGFRELRAGAAGLLSVRASPIDAATHPCFAPSRTWESLTPYQVTRHTKRVGAAEALAADLRAECRRHGLPEPAVTVRNARGVPGLGLLGDAVLTFEVAVNGPIVLGKNRHFGGGLFAGMDRH